MVGEWRLLIRAGEWAMWWKVVVQYLLGAWVCGFATFLWVAVKPGFIPRPLYCLVMVWPAAGVFGYLAAWEFGRKRGLDPVALLTTGSAVLYAFRHAIRPAGWVYAADLCSAMWSPAFWECAN